MRTLMVACSKCGDPTFDVGGLCERCLQEIVAGRGRRRRAFTTRRLVRR